MWEVPERGVPLTRLSRGSMEGSPEGFPPSSLGFASVATFGTLYFPQPLNEVMKIIVSISNRRAIEQNQC